MSWSSFTPYIGKYVNYDDEQISGRVTGVGYDNVSVQLNWQAADVWHSEFSRGVKPSDRSEYPVPVIRIVKWDELQKLVSNDPKYLVEALAISPKQGKIHTTVSNTQPRVARPAVGSHTPVRNGTGNSQEIEIMAKTFAFDSEGTLIGEYDSVKASKAAHKGATDVQHVHAKNFPEGGIGEYASVEDLFPPKPVEESGEKRKRRVTKMEGDYTVVKADGARFQEGDERGALHAALVENNTVEAYMEAAPQVANFTSSRGAAQKVSASGYMAYALKRGWVKLGNGVDDQESEVEIVEE